MTPPGTVTVPSSGLKMLKTLVLSNVLMVGGIFGVAIGLIGVGDWTIIVCILFVVLSTTLYGIAAVRRRPRVIITPEGFVFEKVIGGETRRWEEIEGPFAVIRVGWNEMVGYRFTSEYKARTGKNPTTLFSGYDAVVGANTLVGTAAELAELLNAHKSHYVQLTTGARGTRGNTN